MKGRIYHYPFKCNYLKNQNFFAEKLFLSVLQSTLNFKHFEEKEPHSLSIYENIDSERRG